MKGLTVVGGGGRAGGARAGGGGGRRVQDHLQGRVFQKNGRKVARAISFFLFKQTNPLCQR